MVSPQNDLINYLKGFSTYLIHRQQYLLVENQQLKVDQTGAILGKEHKNFKKVKE